MADNIINPGCREDSPFFDLEIARLVAAQRVQRIEEYRVPLEREARIRKVLGEPEPKGWRDEEKLLDAEHARLVEALEDLA